MCTVSYIPHSKGFILTSNRDEKVFRKTEQPRAYSLNGQKILYPKDTIANGTWIAASEQKRYACLLNGAFEKHERKDKYRLSRGQILLESFNYETILSFIEQINLYEIEPFTLLLLDAKESLKFYELRWDEEKKHVKEINTKLAQIWSSSTLYDGIIRAKREQLFFDWITQYRDDDDVNILNFHTGKHDLIKENNILMNRADELKTVSVSQLLVYEDMQRFEYHDLLENIHTSHLLHEL